MQTGIFYRIQRNGKWKSVALDEMTVEEINDLISHKSTTEVALLIFHLTSSINYFTCGEYCRKERFEAEGKEFPKGEPKNGMEF